MEKKEEIYRFLVDLGLEGPLKTLENFDHNFVAHEFNEK